MQIQLLTGIRDLTDHYEPDLIYKTKNLMAGNTSMIYTGFFQHYKPGPLLMKVMTKIFQAAISLYFSHKVTTENLILILS